jgi:uncharacterized membrane protein
MVLHWVTAFVSTWESYYANHAAVRTLVAFAHVAALIAGAGFAVRADWEVLGLRDDQRGRRRAVLERVRASHQIVVAGLAVIVVSGVLLFASDTQTFLSSRFFWGKMALVALLIVNGSVLNRAERRAAADPDDRRWRPVRVTAAISVLLWFLTTFGGVALPNVG